jgi:hypothetical protein
MRCCTHSPSRPLQAQYNKIRTVLVNERFLNGTEADIQLAKKMILIDSKV